MFLKDSYSYLISRRRFYRRHYFNTIRIDRLSSNREINLAFAIQIIAALFKDSVQPVGALVNHVANTRKEIIIGRLAKTIVLNSGNLRNVEKRISEMNLLEKRLCEKFAKYFLSIRQRERELTSSRKGVRCCQLFESLKTKQFHRRRKSGRFRKPRINMINLNIYRVEQAAFFNDDLRSDLQKFSIFIIVTLVSYLSVGRDYRINTPTKFCLRPIYAKPNER